jgi:hypothetical protein
VTVPADPGNGPSGCWPQGLLPSLDPCSAALTRDRVHQPRTS